VAAAVGVAAAVVVVEEEAPSPRVEGPEPPGVLWAESLALRSQGPDRNHCNAVGAQVPAWK